MATETGGLVLPKRSTALRAIILNPWLSKIREVCFEGKISVLQSPLPDWVCSSHNQGFSGALADQLARSLPLSAPATVSDGFAGAGLPSQGDCAPMAGSA